MDEGFILSIESEVREKKAKAKEKDQRSEAQRLNRAARDTCKDEWKQIKIKHDNTVCDTESGWNSTQGLANKAEETSGAKASGRG